MYLLYQLNELVVTTSCMCKLHVLVGCPNLMNYLLVLVGHTSRMY